MDDHALHSHGAMASVSAHDAHARHVTTIALPDIPAFARNPSDFIPEKRDLSDVTTLLITATPLQLLQLHASHALDAHVHIMRAISKPYRLVVTDAITLHTASLLFDTGIYAPNGITIHTSTDELLELQEDGLLECTLDGLARNMALIDGYQLDGVLDMAFAQRMVQHPVTRMRQLSICCTVAELLTLHDAGHLTAWLDAVTGRLNALSVAEICIVGDATADVLPLPVLKQLYKHFHDWPCITFDALSIEAQGDNRGAASRIVNWVIGHAACTHGPIVFCNLDIGGYGDMSSNMLSVNRTLTSHSHQPPIRFEACQMHHMVVDSRSLDLLLFHDCSLVDMQFLHMEEMRNISEPVFTGHTHLLYSPHQPLSRQHARLLELLCEHTPHPFMQPLLNTADKARTHLKQLNHWLHAYAAPAYADHSLAHSSAVQHRQASILQKTTRVILDLTERLFHVEYPTHADHMHSPADDLAAAEQDAIVGDVHGVQRFSGHPSADHQQ